MSQEDPLPLSQALWWSTNSPLCAHIYNKHEFFQRISLKRVLFMYLTPFLHKHPHKHQHVEPHTLTDVFPLPGGGCVFSGMLLSGGTRHQPIQLRVSTRPPFRPHSLIKPDTRPAAASALPVKLSCAETSEL